MHCTIWNCKCSLNNKISKGSPHFGKLTSYWFLFFLSPVNWILIGAKQFSLFFCRTLFSGFILCYPRRLSWCPFNPQEGKQSANEESDMGHDAALQDSVVRRKRTLQSLATFFSVGNCFLFFNCFWPGLVQNFFSNHKKNSRKKSKF